MNCKDYKQRFSRAAITLLLLFVTTAATWAQSLDGWGYQPVGQVESYSVNHGSLSLSGWGLDPNDRDYKTQVTVYLKQNDEVKYHFDFTTSEYLSNCGGNATWRGYHGFQMPTTEVDPGTYQLSVLIYNKPGTSGENQYATFSDDATEKTITILPRQYTITLHANYDGGTNPAPMSCADNITYWLPSMSRPGYTFAGWREYTDHGELKTQSVKNESAELYAVWLTGTGTEANPIIIYSNDDIDVFSSGASYAAGHVRLENNLTITKTIKAGSGFDGNGHTITFKPQGVVFGLFKSGGNYIRNLKVEGTFPELPAGNSTTTDGIGGLIRENRHYTSDLLIENCVISIDFPHDYSATGKPFGCFVGWVESFYDWWDPSNLIIRNCVFNGSLSCNGKWNGGFVGYINHDHSEESICHLQFENCFFAPKVMVSKPDYTFCKEYERAEGIYYTEPGTVVQGEKVYENLPDDGVYTVLSTAFDSHYYLPQSAVAFSGLSDSYTHTGSPIAISYTVSKDGTPLAANAYTAVIRNAEGAVVASVQEIGQYTLEVTIDGNTYARVFYVTGPLTQTDGIYQINNVSDWMTFAADVANGNTYNGSTVCLNADVSTNVMVGTEDYKFSGTFDGNGHTLTYNYISEATTYDPAEDGCAPFRYIDGATISDLTVAGSTVSTGRQMAGLVAYATGDNSILDCVVRASLTSRLSGDTSNGGFVAQLTSGSINFSGCTFNGSMVGTGAHSNGGFVGWSGGTLSFTDCLFNPVHSNMKSSGSSTFARSGNSTFTNTYYTTAFGAVQGTLAYTTAQNSLCEKLTMTGGNDIYVVRSSSIEGMAATYYEYNGGADVTVSGYSVAYNGATLPANKYIISIRNSAGEEVSAPTAIGRYTLTATGNNSESYFGSVSKEFWVVKTLATDANGFYLIGNNSDWLSLDYYVKNVPASVGCNVKMTADVSVTTMIGNDAHPFCGVFDGTGHTLIVNLTGSNFVGPFPYANNATFINLHVAGTVRSSVDKAMVGGLVGYALGNLNIISCRSSVDIGRSNWGYAGGFVGTSGSDETRSITFSNCLFDGTLRGELAVCAGFVGACYSYGANSTETFTNCLMSGTVDTSQGSIIITYPFHGSATDPVCSNCYHKFSSAPSSQNYYPDNQGSYTALTGTALRDKLGSGWTLDGSGTVVPNMATLSMRNITVASGIAHGTVECQRLSLPGKPVTISLTPDENYVIATVSYNDGTDHLVSPQNGSYSFTMPDADVTVRATFGVSPLAILYKAYNTETGKSENHFMPKANATEVTAETTVLGTAGNESWYVVSNNIEVSERMAVYGTVHLVLRDSKTMTAAKGISVHSGNTLCIYGQEAGTGTLNATGCQVRLGATNESAAIGSEGSNNYTLGNIVIHGGIVNATGYENTAAIGGGAYNPAGGSIAIYGGTVSAAATNPHWRQQEAIGKGDCGDNRISKTLADGMYVKVGDEDTPVGYNYRISNLGQKVVTVAPCTEHDWNNNVCSYCGLNHHWQLAYDGNGATDGEVPATATYILGGDMTVTVSGNGSLTRIGYNFAGWNTEADGSGTAYAANATFTISSMVTLYAQWTPIEYTISYTLDGGSVATANPTSYTIESAAITLNNPTRDGYNFMGWTGTDLPRATRSVTIPAGSTGNRSYIALWKEAIPCPEGMAVDEDYQPNEAGYYYVKMPNPDYNWYDDLGEEVSFSEEENPKYVTIPEEITSFRVYDHGGKTRIIHLDEYDEDVDLGKYDYNSAGSLILTCPEGYFFKVEGGTTQMNDDDWLTIYDGNSTDCEKLLVRSNDASDVSPFLTTGNSITFNFILDNSMDGEGFDIVVSVMRPLPLTTLANDDSQYAEGIRNTSLIANMDGEDADITIDGRSISKNGDWNTLCLPFDIDNIVYSPLKGATVKSLSSTNYNDGTLTMNFSDNPTSIEAGKPYIVKWDKIAYNATSGTAHPQGSEARFGYQNLVDGNLDTKCESSCPFFCEFEALGSIDVTGYTFSVDKTTSYGKPKVWTLKGRLNADDEWTILDSRDVNKNPDDAIASYTSSRTYDIAENKRGIYRYFRLDVSEANYYLSLFDLNIEGSFNAIDIVNPTFRNVTIENSTTSITTDHADFTGTFSSLESTEGRLLDGYNPEGNAMNATIGISYEPIAPAGYTFGGWYKDEQCNDTIDFIPFADDGTVKLYAKWIENALELANAKDNNAAISEAITSEKLYNVTLTDRILYKDGDWNTLCLPFDVDDFTDTPLEGATVKTLESTEFSDGTLTMNFSDDLTSIEAGVPYIVKWTSGEDIKDPKFTGVTISSATANVETDYMDFIGIYSPTVIYEEGSEKHNLYLGSKNNIYYPTRKDYAVKACRGYFTLTNGLTIADVTKARLSFGDETDGETDEVREVKEVREVNDDSWYDTSGRKLVGKPTKAGLYINNGKKVVIK